ncbi:MAG: alpha/beta fold hydrolase [Vicinamibacterales bacterium]
MTIEPALRDIPGAVGSLEALLDLPAGPPRAVVVLAHPLPTAGGTMHTKMIFQAAKGLTRSGCAVLRFNFRGVGRSAGTFDEGRGEQDDFRAAVDYAAARFPGLEIWGGGGSFGAFVGMTASSHDPRVVARIGIAAPVNRYDFSEVLGTVKPTFLVHGEDDELIPLELVREFYARLEEPKELVVIDSANHLFEGQASEVGDALEELLGDFLVSTPGSADGSARP